MEKIIKENIIISEDKNSISYTFKDGSVLEAKIIWGSTNHFGEDFETIDYIEKVENSFEIKNEEEYIEEIYTILEDIIPFK